MIKARYVNQENDRYLCCDSCNEYLPIVIIYNLLDGTGRASWNRFVLCEDCSNGLSGIHYNSVLNECDYMFNPHTENKNEIIKKV